MSSISIAQAKKQFGGTTEAETLENLAKATGCRRIYKYANAYGDKVTHTDYVRVEVPGSAQEAEIHSSEYTYNVVLAYDNGVISTGTESEPTEP